MLRAARLAGSLLSVALLMSGLAEVRADEPKPEVPRAAEAASTEEKSEAEKPEAEEPEAAKPDAENEGGDKEGNPFLRVTRDRDGLPQSLDTAVVRYVPADGKEEVAVDLVGAVHIGEKSYYRALNKLFQEYDVVLFELVMEKGTRVPDGKTRSDGMLSNMVKSMLELDLQVERIDYTKKHFVHADMTPTEMGEAMRKRGDTGLTVTLSVITDMIREANRREQQMRAKRRRAAEPDLFGALFGNDGTLDLKRAMADQMEESGDAGAFGSTLTTMLIADRNEACMKVLARELKKGHKKIAIFYGAAHLPDFDERLKKEFGMKPDKTTWMTAWDLSE